MEPTDPHYSLVVRLLQENQRLLKDNHQLLIELRRRAQLGFVGSAFRLAILVGVIVYGYVYFLEPQLSSLRPFTFPSPHQPVTAVATTTDYWELPTIPTLAPTPSVTN